LPNARIFGVSGSLLEALAEEELASVVFVADYVQLDFSTARFSAFAWPTVTIGDTTLHFGDRGYRDALCAFITHEALSTEESSEAGLVIRFGLGEIATNPGPSDLSGPEIAQLQVNPSAFRDEGWAVWRSGEGIFAGHDS